MSLKTRLLHLPQPCQNTLMSWRSYQSVTAGELSIDGALRGRVLEFGFGDDSFFFFLHKTFGDSKQTVGVGPYFRISVPLLNLLAELSPEELRSAKGKFFTFAGERVGEMDINWGRMAADDGAITRPVLSLQLWLSRAEDGYQISMKGETGPVDPNSIFEPDPEIMKPCRFEVSFLLKRNHIERMLADHPLNAKLLGSLN